MPTSQKSAKLEEHLRAELKKLHLKEYAINDATRFEHLVPEKHRLLVINRAKRWETKEQRMGFGGAPIGDAKLTIGGIKKTAKNAEQDQGGVCHTLAQLGAYQILAWLKTQENLKWELQIISSAPKKHLQASHTFATLELNNKKYIIDPWATGMQQDEHHGFYPFPSSPASTKPKKGDYPFSFYLSAKDCNLKEIYTVTSDDKDELEDVETLAQEKPDNLTLEKTEFLRELKRELENATYDWQHSGHGVFARTKTPDGIARLKSIIKHAHLSDSKQVKKAFIKAQQILTEKQDPLFFTFFGLRKREAKVQELYTKFYNKSFEPSRDFKEHFLKSLENSLDNTVLEWKSSGHGLFGTKKTPDGIARLKKALKGIEYNNAKEVSKVFDKVQEILKEKQNPLFFTFFGLRKREGKIQELYNDFYNQSLQPSVELLPMERSRIR